MMRISIDGNESLLRAVEQSGQVYVPLDDFCKAIDAEMKPVPETGMITVCRGDLCVPLNGGEPADTMTVNGVLHGRLAAFAEPMDVSWALADGRLVVANDGADAVGLGVGDVPPAFTLPDLFSGASISSKDFLGKRTAFYMWASW